MTSILHLLKKDLKTELRQKDSINGILLYVITTVFVVYLIFNSIEDLSTWVALFWIILLFAATNASMNTFKQESSRQFLYYYNLCSPQAIIISKILYHAIIVLLLGIIQWFIFSLLLGNPLENNIGFGLVLLTGSIGIASSLTMISGIASKTNNNASLTAILAFPIILPLLLSSIKASMLCGLGFELEESLLYIGLLALINVVIVALSYILFPYLWRS